MAENKFVWGAILIVFGAFFCLFGKAMLGVTVFLCTTALTFLIGVYLTFKGLDYFGHESSKTVFWIVIGCFGLFSLSLGFCFYKLQKYGVIMLGAVAGLMIAHVVTCAVLIKNRYIWWAITVSCPVALGIFTCACHKNIRIVFTALIGAYSVTRGISSYAGGFPNELELQQ